MNVQKWVEMESRLTSLVKMTLEFGQGRHVLHSEVKPTEFCPINDYIKPLLMQENYDKYMSSR